MLANACLTLTCVALVGWPSAVVSRVTSRKLSPSAESSALDLLMPSVRPAKSDDYVCTAMPVPSQSAANSGQLVGSLYAIQFEPRADMDRVHHMLLFGCSDIDVDYLSPGYWRCGHSRLCAGMTIMYAWGRNAPPLRLPDGVGFRIGAKSSISYLVLQVHYARTLAAGETDSSGVTIHYTYTPQKYIAGIHLFSSNDGVIPPRKDKYSLDINCALGGREPIYPFAYRVHAHALGVVVTGYKYTQANDTWTLLAKGNPQWPQAFYPMDHVYMVATDDILAARCTYNSSSRSAITRMGSTAADEMCNLYIMYYTLSKSDRSFGICVDQQIRDLSEHLPPDSDRSLPPNPQYEEMAHSHGGGGDGDDSETLTAADDNDKSRLAYAPDDGWPLGPHTLGQVTGIDVDDATGHVVVFHRGDHVWNQRSFDVHNRYQLLDDGPIANNTIVAIDPNSRRVAYSWGANLFYLPHGLTIDRNNRSIWLTDVALHQVFRFPLSGSTQPDLVLGVRFTPGSDEKHFCKPTSVAVASVGDIYVADGYCNSRVIRFDSTGKFLNQWGHSDPIGYFVAPPPSAFSIPHKIVLIEDRRLACVADREHGRVQCFRVPHGEFEFDIRRDEFNGRLFSVAYSPSVGGGSLFAVSGPSLYSSPDVRGFAFNITSRQMIAAFAPKSGTFNQPHDIAVSPDGQRVFVVEIGPNNVWMFSRTKTTISANSKGEPKSSSKSSLSELKSQPKSAIIDQTQTPNSLIVSPTTGPTKPVLRGIGGAPLFPESSTNGLLVVSLLVLPMLILVVVWIAITLRRSSSATGDQQSTSGCLGSTFKHLLSRGYGSRGAPEKYNLGGLLGGVDPKRDGFNRVPMEESSDIDDRSDSEVEEFNASSVNGGAGGGPTRKV